MEPQEKLTTQQFIADRLHDVQRKVEAGNIQDALDELKEVKAADSKNIYIIAIEKQILKLTDAATPADLRSEIVKSLPPMVERAINDSQRRLAEKAQEPKESKEKEAALEKLKSQYFQRADEYVEKGDYEHALEEIRRIYIIDPNNVVAKEYEQKIQQLASLKAKDETQEKATPQEVPVAPAKKEQAVIETAEEAEKGKSKLPLIAAAAVIIIGIGVWFVLSNGSKEESQQPPVTKEEQTVAAQQPSQQPTSVESTTPATGKTKAETKPAETKSTPAPTQQPAQAKVEQKQPPRQEETPKPAASTPPVQQTPPQQQAQQPTTTQAAQQPATTQQAQQPQPVATTPPADEGAAPKPFVVIESPPQIVRREAPKYPEIAYRMRMEGKVVIEVTVDPQGKPIQAKVARSSSDVFNEAAIEAAMKSTYKPAMMSTGPVTAKVYVPFDFKLR